MKDGKDEGAAGRPAGPGRPGAGTPGDRDSAPLKDVVNAVERGLRRKVGAPESEGAAANSATGGPRTPRAGREICPLCDGTGWVVAVGPEPGGAEGGVAAGVGGGGAPVARRCACFVDRLNRDRMRRASIPKRYEACSFDNFKPNNDSQRHALKIAQKFVKNYPEQEVGLLFIGPCGVGKTHLAAAIARTLVLEKGVSCVFYDFRDLIREIQATFSQDTAATETTVLNPVFRSDVLVLDELGAKRTGAWVEETVFYIINHRYNNKKVTVFTSNYPDSGEDEEDRRDAFYKKGGESLVDRIGERLRSRVYEMCKIVPVEGEDFRKTIKQAGYRF